MALFLMAVLCFLILEEADRVASKLCDSFGPVHMEDCAEGMTADGYQVLCWVTIAIVALAALGVLFSFFKRRLATTVSVKTAVLSKSIYLYIAAFVTVAIGVGIYAFFITMVVYQVSCGSSTDEDLDLEVFQHSTTSWDYGVAERVLMFFTIAMTLWHFSFAAFAFEFLTASITAQSFFLKEETPANRMKTACRHLVKQLGSVLLAAALVPPCRAIAHVLQAGQSLSKRLYIGKVFGGVQVMCRYESFMRIINSNGVALLAMSGLPFKSACNEAVKRMDSNSRVAEVQSSGLLIWLNQLALLLVGPVFVMYWVLHEDEVFQDVVTEEVSSVIAMGLFSLVFSWFLAQVYAGYARGTLHGALMTFLMDRSGGNRRCESELLDFLEGPKSVVQQPNRAPTPDKDNKPAKETPRGPVGPIPTPKAEVLTTTALNQPPPDSRSGNREQVPPNSRSGNREQPSAVDISAVEADQLIPRKSPRKDEP